MVRQIARPISRRTLGKLAGPAILAVSMMPKWSLAAEGKSIAYVTIAISDPFVRILSAGIESVVKQNGGMYAAFDSKGSAQTQMQNAQDVIARKVDGIIISPTDSSTCAPVLAEAEKAGIPVVIADIGTTGGEYVSYITSANYDGAYQTAKVMTKAMADRGWAKGKVGVISVSLARINGQLRTQGFRDAIKEAGMEEVALSQMQNYTADETYKFTQDMLTAHPEMHGLFIETALASLGGLRAIKTSRRDNDLVFVAFDGLPEYVPAIQSGAMTAAGMQQPYLMGTTCGTAMFDHLAGKTPEKQINVPVLVVTKENIDQLLPELKTHVFGQS